MCNVRAARPRMATIWPIATFASLLTFLPHLGHHHILVLFIVTGLDTMTIEVVYDTSLGTTIRAARGDS
jgi:hypothetical protein